MWLNPYVFAYSDIRCKPATRYFIYLIIVMIKPIIYGFNILALGREPFDIFMSICYSWIKVPILRQILCLWIQHINIVFCHTREEFSNLATFERGNLDDHWKMTFFNQHVGLKFPKLFFFAITCHWGLMEYVQTFTISIFTFLILAAIKSSINWKQLGLLKPLCTFNW